MCKHNMLSTSIKFVNIHDVPHGNGHLTEQNNFCPVLTLKKIQTFSQKLFNLYPQTDAHFASL